LSAVTSVDGITAGFYPFDMTFLGRAATRIINEVKGVNRVVYDVTSKPPARSSGSEGGIPGGCWRGIAQKREGLGGSLETIRG
jgi:hypothetical protein